MPALLAFVWLSVIGQGGTPSPALTIWQAGQDALAEGDTEKAVACFQRSLQLDATLARNHLSLAAGHLGLGDEPTAADHLARYVHLQPDHVAARSHYAELLLRLGRTAEASGQFQRVIAATLDDAPATRERLIHCHSRLMEIAEAEADDYGAHLHRGIGLYLLARERARVPTTGRGPSAEGLLCRAAGELSLARQERPDEARPCWYLHAIWSRLAQAQPSARWLRAAQDAAPSSYLTPAEQAELQLACRNAERITSRR